MTTNVCQDHHPNDAGSNLRGADVLFSPKSKNLVAWKWDVAQYLFNIGVWDQSQDKETVQVSPFSYYPVCSLCVCLCVRLSPWVPAARAGPAVRPHSCSRPRPLWRRDSGDTEETQTNRRVWCKIQF